jgi:hypothetical protein
MRSQMPVIRRRRFLMNPRRIDICHPRIMLNHLQRAVTQQVLQGKDIPARAQVGDREGVTETVGVGMRHPRLLPQPTDQLAQRVAPHWVPVTAHKQRRLRVLSILLAGSQVAPQRAPRSLAQVDKAPFAAFGVPGDPVLDGDLPSLLVHIADVQPAYFGSAQPGIQQDHNDRLVAVTGDPLHGKRAPAFGLGLQADIAGFDQSLNLLACERLNWFLGELGRGDIAHRAGDFELLSGPGEECAQRDPDIAHRLGGQLNLVVSGNAPWRILVQHITQVVAHILWGELAHILVARVLNPHFQVTGIRLDSSVA